MAGSFEDVARLPRPLTAAPSAIQWSPDDQFVTFLKSGEGSLVQQLFGYEINTQSVLQLVNPGELDTEESLSLEEKLRRERMRTMGVGVTSYMWTKCTTRNIMRVLLPIHGELLVQDFPMNSASVLSDNNRRPSTAGSLRVVVPAGVSPPLAPQLSPCGTMVGYVRDGELFICDIDEPKERQLTQGARERQVTNGLAEYCAMEEMDRQAGFWFSPQSTFLAFCEVDERHIPQYRIDHQGVPGSGPIPCESHRYPFAGGENAHVRLGVIDIATLQIKWMDIASHVGQDHYIARVHWLSDESLLAAVLSRDQSTLYILRFDNKKGICTELLREVSDTWVNIYPENMFSDLSQSNGKSNLSAGTDVHPIEFLWSSEQTGYRHLYRAVLAGKNGPVRLQQLTFGEWQVDKVVAIDRKNQWVYFMGTRDSPLECHMYRVSLTAGTGNDEPLRITRESGMHDCTMNEACTQFADTFSSLDTPPTVSIRSVDGASPSHVIHSPPKAAVAGLKIVKPEIFSFLSDTGETLFGAMYRPPVEKFGSGPFPTCSNVYGGPHVQRVCNSWAVTVDMRAQLEAMSGILVFRLDNRGSTRRGHAFEAHIRYNMGDLEVKDQAAAVHHLAEMGLCDRAKVGVYGWSYGGYLALMCLARAPETFHVAVAGAPVTHWDGYDTCYTERYMGHPLLNQSGYETSSVMAHVGAIKGNLMLVHGLIDENVHFRHTARLLTYLNRERKRYSLLLFPEERHSPRSLRDRTYMEERIHEFLCTSLGVPFTAS